MSAGVEQGFDEAVKELKKLKTTVEKADDLRARLLLEKLEADESKAEAQKEMMACVHKQECNQKEFHESMNTLKDEIQKISKSNKSLEEKLRKYRAQLKATRAESTKLKQKFKINALIPLTDVKFLGRKKEVKECTDDINQLIKGVFTISQRAAVLLQGGQALITFEEEKVASQILNMTSCLVTCENSTLDVKPKEITLETPVKFEVHLDVSRRELTVFDIPPAIPEDRMKDRLEMSFSKVSRGGGEVESVDYDETTGTGRVTFLHPGVAVNLAMRGEYKAKLESEEKLKVGPTFRYDLQKFQTFCGSAKRTILLEDIEDKEDEEDLQDHLEIHFQKPSNSGGEIECIKYISRGKALQAFFCEEELD